jgi:hypothetical protein
VTAVTQRAGTRCRVSALRILLAIDAAVVLLGTVAIGFEVRSVLAVGPVLALVAAITLVRAIVLRHWPAGVAAAGHLMVCGLFRGLVFALHWGPEQAARPFRWMSAGYTAVTVWAVRHQLPGDHVPGVCERCGYNLRGLPEPRCPECGQPFDPAPHGNLHDKLST